MSRLFVTPRELNFISDITKELIKDIVGQKIFYYPMSILKSKIHDIYNESLEKVYDNPIEIEALVDTPANETKTNEFGPDEAFTIEVFIQYRDLIEKEIKVEVGDFFSYGENFFEIKTANWIGSTFGQIENKIGIKLSGHKARENIFKARLLGPTDRSLSDEDSIQTTFKQEHGTTEGDHRALIENGILPVATVVPEISNKGDPNGVGSAFYGDD